MTQVLHVEIEGTHDGKCTIHGQIKHGKLVIERIDRDSDKCLVYGCQNYKGGGKFIGDLCTPCYQMITTGEIGDGETFVHRLHAAVDENYHIGYSAALDQLETTISEARKR